MSSAICFHMNQSKILSYGNGLILKHTTGFYTLIMDSIGTIQSICKPHKNETVFQMMKYAVSKLENIVEGKGKITDHQNFLHFPPLSYLMFLKQESLGKKFGRFSIIWKVPLLFRLLMTGRKKSLTSQKS